MGYRIAHIGAFDFESYGDLLFPDVLRIQLDKRIEIEEILYFAPKACKMPNRDIDVHAINELEDIVRKCKIDAIIVGGGDIIQMQMTKTHMPHISDCEVLYEVLYIWIIPSMVAKKYSIPLLWNAPGVPLHFAKEEKELVSYLCEAVDYISVRDQESQKELEYAIGGEHIHVVPDTVLCIRDLVKKEELIKKFDELDLPFLREQYVFFQCNMPENDDYYESCANALRKIKEETGWQVLLQPIGYSVWDEQVMGNLQKRYSGEFIYSPRHYSQYELLTLIANASLYIGTSLHGCITANSYGVRNIVINVNNLNKIDGFSKLIGMKTSIIHKPDEILNAFFNNEIIEESVIQEKICQITYHFDKMAKIISQSERSEKDSKDDKLANYINANFLRVRELEEQINNLHQTMKQILEKKEQEINFYKSLSEEVLNSTSWKATKPLRKITNILKGRGN